MGRLSILGGLPGIVLRISYSLSILGMVSNNPIVYGCDGFKKTSVVKPYSIILPPYRTNVFKHASATIPIL